MSRLPRLYVVERRNKRGVWVNACNMAFMSRKEANIESSYECGCLDHKHLLGPNLRNLRKCPNIRITIYEPQR